MPDTLSFMSSDIQKELNNLTEDEKKVAIEILKQYSQSGSSDVYQDLIYQDYEEIPVDIETFLYNEYYLGKSLIDAEGRKTVYPYWVETLKKIFPTNVDTAYNTLALTGSIGIGKSFMAVLCILYQLYRMMCLKDPYLHYGLQPIDKITFAFINITMDAAAGVGWQKCQELLQNSPWFMKNGSLSGSTNIVWVPPKGIDLLYGSLPRHILGRAVFSCLDGDTLILTENGEARIAELENKSIRVPTLSDKHVLVLSEECTVKETGVFTEEYQLELEDGTILHCTPNHRFMLKNGQYKEAKDLTIEDELEDILLN